METFTWLWIYDKRWLLGVRPPRASILWAATCAINILLSSISKPSSAAFDNTKLVLSACMAIKFLYEEKKHNYSSFPRPEDREMLMYWLGKEVHRSFLGIATFVFSLYVAIEEMQEDTLTEHDSKLRLYSNLAFLCPLIAIVVVFFVVKPFGAIVAYLWRDFIVYKRKHIIDWY